MTLPPNKPGKGGLDDFPFPHIVTKADKFIAKLDAMMKENTPESYRFIVCHNEKVIGSGVGGMSRHAVDAPATAATLEDRLNIASMSKLVTAVAVLATLQAKKLTPETLVAPFMPPDWTLSAEVKKLTFKDFMTHRSGFYWEPGEDKPKQDGTGYDVMKAIMAQKPFNPIKTSDSYRNINYAIFRVVLPYLDSYDVRARKVTLAPVRDKNSFLSKRYVEIVNQMVLKPSGVAPAGCDAKTIVLPNGPSGRPPASNPVAVLAYPFKKPQQKGVSEGDSTLFAGASGWSLSVGDMARIIQTVLHTDLILSPKYRAYVLTPNGRGCGMNAETPIAGSEVHSHGGWIPFEEGAPADGAQYAGWFYYFGTPQLIVVALSNSGHDPAVIKAKGNWDARTKAAFVDVYDDG